MHFIFSLSLSLSLSQQPSSLPSSSPSDVPSDQPTISWMPSTSPSDVSWANTGAGHLLCAIRWHIYEFSFTCNQISDYIFLSNCRFQSPKSNSAPLFFHLLHQAMFLRIFPRLHHLVSLRIFVSDWHNIVLLVKRS